MPSSKTLDRIVGFHFLVKVDIKGRPKFLGPWGSDGEQSFTTIFFFCQLDSAPLDLRKMSVFIYVIALPFVYFTEEGPEHTSLLHAHSRFGVHDNGLIGDHAFVTRGSRPINAP